MRRFAMLWGMLVLGGCVSSIAQRQAELQHWIGQPETELVQSMGVPNRTYTAGGMKFLTYEERQTVVYPGTPYWQGMPPYWYGTGGALPPQTVSYACDTTFTIAGGTVRAFSLRGNGC